MKRYWQTKQRQTTWTEARRNSDGRQDKKIMEDNDERQLDGRHKKGKKRRRETT